LYNAEVVGISYYLPETRLSNNELLMSIGNLSTKLLDKIGVNERRIASNNEFVSDLAVNAGNKLFDEYDISPMEVDFLILCTQTPDYFLPTTACLVQQRLGLKTNCGAFDINLGCSGFIYALSVAASLIHSKTISNLLLINADTYTRLIHPKDKSTRPIFGDGASAVFIKYTKNSKIKKFVFGTDGNGADNLIVRSSAMKNRINQLSENIDRFGNTVSDSNLYMNGPEIFKFTMDMVPKLVNETLCKNNILIDNIDYFVFHQASKYLLENIREKIGISDDKFCIKIEEVGNTVSATIPIALKIAEKDGLLKKGMSILIAGFGVGYSWGATVIKW
jgi:3-oxoacyl-[acyl-carrier-protein] synthase-3